MSGLRNLRSIYIDELIDNHDTFTSTQPLTKFDTRFNYNENDSIPQLLNFSVDIEAPVLDAKLRGRIYNPVQFSQDITGRNFFVLPEGGPYDGTQESKFLTEAFDPRSTTPKLDTLYFNTNRTLGTLQYGEGGFIQNTTFNTKITDFSTAGIDELPFTPLSQLGVSFYNGDQNNENNLSWKRLYNKNHTPKTNANWQGITSVYDNYGSAVTRNNLKMGDRDGRPRYGEKSGLFGASRGTEPYIIRDIGDRDNKGSFGSSFEDIDRLTQYHISTQGLLSRLLYPNINTQINTVVTRGKKLKDLRPDGTKTQDKIESLRRVPQRFNNGSNFISFLSGAFRPFGQSPFVLSKSGLNMGTPGTPSLTDEHALTISNLTNVPNPGNLYNYGEGTTVAYHINDSFTGGVNKGGIAAKFFDLSSFLAGLSGKVIKNNYGDKMTLAPMITGKSLDVIEEGATVKEQADFLGGEPNLAKFKNAKFQKGKTFSSLSEGNQLAFNIEEASDGMPFYFKDLRDNSYIFFRAYLEGITENVTPTWSSVNYIGRSEPVYNYERGEREISFTLKLVAQTKFELYSIYEKMDVLTSLCYPQYVGTDDYGNRMKPPLTRFRMGEMFGNTNSELLGFIKSLSYSVENSSTYETDPGFRVPRHVNATIGYQVIHNSRPSNLTNFYGINGTDNTSNLFGIEVPKVP